MSYGNVISGVWQSYISISSVTSTPTTTTINYTYGVNLVKTLSGNTFEYKFNSSNWSIPKDGSCKKAGWHQFGAGSYTVNRGYSDYYVTLSYLYYKKAVIFRVI